MEVLYSRWLRLPNGLERQRELGHDLLPRNRSVEVKDHVPEAVMFEATLYDLKSCALLGDEQDSLPVSDQLAYQVGDRLALASTWGADHHPGVAS